MLLKLLMYFSHSIKNMMENDKLKRQKKKLNVF